MLKIFFSHLTKFEWSEMGIYVKNEKEKDLATAAWACVWHSNEHTHWKQFGVKVTYYPLMNESPHSTGIYTAQLNVFIFSHL